MREARLVVPAEPALDAVSAQLGEMLRRADALLAEWSAFGDEVRTRVTREVATISDVVAEAIDRAALGTTAASVERQFAEHLATRLTALGTELARLEGRARAASRAALDDRRGDRRVLWLGVAGIAIANALLAVILIRGPSVPPPVALPEAVRVEAPPIAPLVVAPPDAAPPPDTAPPPDAAPPVKAHARGR